MKTLRSVATGLALFIVGGCADGPAILDPEPSANSVQDQAAVAASRVRRIAATGQFDAVVDFTTLTLTPFGRHCLLQVKGRLVFSGTLEGPGIGQTTALVFAACPDVASNPPGTFADVFHSDLEFDGLVNGQPATANVRYFGRSEPGGHITAHLLLSQGVQGLLAVDAQLAVGGEYDGAIIVGGQ
jgi:hypothetical protein